MSASKVETMIAGETDDVLALSTVHRNVWVERPVYRRPEPNQYVVVAAIAVRDEANADVRRDPYNYASIDHYGKSRLCCPDGRVFSVDAGVQGRGLSARFATFDEARRAVEAFMGIKIAQPATRPAVST